MYKKRDAQLKGISLFGMVIWLMILLIGCGREASVYNSLSDYDKYIVEIVCDNSEKFVNTEVDRQVIRFVNWNNNMYFLVQDYEKGDNAYIQISEQCYIIKDDTLVETEDYDYWYFSRSGVVQSWSTESPREACAKAIKSCLTSNNKYKYKEEE